MPAIYVYECNEIIYYNLLTLILLQQINHFRNNINENYAGQADMLLEKNWRPPQNLNGRTVYTNVDSDNSGERSALYTSTTLLLGMALVKVIQQTL